MSEKKEKKKLNLGIQILIGIGAGILIGLVSPKAAELLSPLGDIFMRMLKMLIVPLVFFSITSGITKMGNVNQLLSVGAAGVKGAGVVMSTVLLEAIGMPLTIIPIIAAIWPTIDPIHTLLNNTSDLVGTALIARGLGEMEDLS